ncbi:MAG: sialidase family protein [Planctomycetota bacterium]
MYQGMLLSILGVLLGAAAEQPKYEAENVFPFHPKHNHAPGIVECPNGDLIVSWYRGSGERSADDVAVYGSRKKKGESHWSPAFVMADNPGFPDGNTCMMVDRQNKLWLFWPIVLANSWESCLTAYRVSSDYQKEGEPKWDWQGVVLLKPVDFATQFDEALEREKKRRKISGLVEAAYVAKVRVHANVKLSQRLGWQTRCKPIVLPSGRILLPLYTDTFSVSLIAISDDGGVTWYASQPLWGFGNIQPTLLRKNDGTIVAYMRENGTTERIRVCESKDEGLTWGPVLESELLNPGAGVDGVRLANGHWALVYNDQKEGRNKLAVSISDDEGKTWKWTRHLENQEKGSFHYPVVIQGADGMIHAVYSYFVDEGKTMKHAAFNEAWVQAGDPK